MSVVHVKDLAYVRLQSPDLDQAEEFLTNLGMARSAGTADRLYMRGTDPSHHIHVTHLGPPKYLGLAFWVDGEDELKSLSQVAGATGIDELERRRVRIPLVADIHYTPNAALVAADCVEKVRINPGNYADRKKFEVREYSDAEYAAELARVAERFRPLVRRCKQNGVAMRIGTNHGSLSDRVMNRYGDTPRGMVESALEFLDVCEDEGFHDVVFSMKASNPQVAIQAYRLLAAHLAARARAGPPRRPSLPRRRHRGRRRRSERAPALRASAAVAGR